MIAAWDGKLDWMKTLCRKLRDSAQLIQWFRSAVSPASRAAFRCALQSRTDRRRARHVPLQVTIGKFVSGELFGLERYLPPGTPIHADAAA